MQPTTQTLADQTTADIMQAIKKETEPTGVLTALELHYETLHKSQEMYIEYMTEFIARLKETQRKDKDSLSNLKKEVLRHILDMEKTKK